MKMSDNQLDNGVKMHVTHLKVGPQVTTGFSKIANSIMMSHGTIQFKGEACRKFRSCIRRTDD